MSKDYRYDVIKAMMQVGRITEFSPLLSHIPKNTIAADLNSSHRRVTKLGAQLDELKLRDVYNISKLVGVEMEDIYRLAERQFLAKKAETGKKRKSQ